MSVSSMSSRLLANCLRCFLWVFFLGAENLARGLSRTFGADGGGGLVGFGFAGMLSCGDVLWWLVWCVWEWLE